MYETILIATYLVTSIGYAIQIYNMKKEIDHKPINVCLWTANGTGYLVIIVYCYFNNLADLMFLFIVQYVFCFICLTINMYYTFMISRTQLHLVEERNATFTLPETFTTNTDTDIESNIMMTNPLYKSKSKQIDETIGIKS